MSTKKKCFVGVFYTATKIYLEAQKIYFDEDKFLSCSYFKITEWVKMAMYLLLYKLFIVK